MDFLTLFISLKCTHSCAHCLYGCSPDKGEHMSWNVFSRSLDILEENHITTVNFFGGEPLLNPQIFPMLKAIQNRDLNLILATNCKPLNDDNFLQKFLEITGKYKEHISIVTAADKFHLQFFDPKVIIDRLKNLGYRVIVDIYSDRNILLSEYNKDNPELLNLNTHFSCCRFEPADNLGILPDGKWTICPPSLDGFGNIFSNSLSQMVAFKLGLPLKYRQGCTLCLLDFKKFHQQFLAFITESSK